MEKEPTVIKIVDKSTVFINIDTKSITVKKNQPLYIYEQGPEITDLEGNNLGRYDFIKAEVYVKEIYPKFVVAKYQKKYEEQSTIASLTSMYTNQSFTDLTLNVDESEIDKISPLSNKVKIGDKVKFYRN